MRTVSPEGRLVRGGRRLCVRRSSPSKGETVDGSGAAGGGGQTCWHWSDGAASACRSGRQQEVPPCSGQNSHDVHASVSEANVKKRSGSAGEEILTRMLLMECADKTSSRRLRSPWLPSDKVIYFAAVSILFQFCVLHGSEWAWLWTRTHQSEQTEIWQRSEATNFHNRQFCFLLWKSMLQWRSMSFRVKCRKTFKHHGKTCTKKAQAVNKTFREFEYFPIFHVFYYHLQFYAVVVEVHVLGFKWIWSFYCKALWHPYSNIWI